MKLFRRVLVATSLFAALTAASLRAQDQEEVSGPGPAPNQTQNQNQNNDSAQDPPGRAARLQYIQGSVSVQPGGTGDWVEGALNRPLTNADNIWTDKSARTELNVGSGILRLNSESSLTLTNVGDNSVQVQLHQGTLNLRVRKLYDGEIYEVDTPNMAFTVQKSGEYRFDVNPDGDASFVTVFKGQGDATGEGPAVHVKDHERARFHEGQSLAHEFSPAPGYDGFDDWCRVRDKREGTVSAQYVAPDVVGYEDLDEYGTWTEVPEYGHIWRPRVSVGWAPYREGHWAYIGLWGWTWVDDSPWGYAPFHYGRWVNYDGYWGWAPGPRYIRPVYAPALVTWFGGAGWGVGLGFGGGYGYGWCPLGWGEPYRPWYHYSRGYFGRVNYSNTRITNVYNYYGRNDNNFRYANMRYAGGRTAASRESIIGSRPIGRSFVNVPERNFQNSHLGGRLDIAPDRSSRLGVNAGRAAAVPPQRAFSRPVASRMSAPGRSERADVNRGGAFNNRSQGGQANGRFVPRPGATNPNAGQARGNDRNGGFNGRNDTRQTGQNEARNNRSFVPRPGANAPGANQARTANTARTPNNASEPNRGFQGQRNESGNNQAARSNSGNNNIPRPTAGVRSERSDMQRSESPRSNESVRSAPAQNNRGAERSAPRPTENGGARNAERQSGGQRNSGRPDGGHSFMSVPRPSGQVRSASSYYGSSAQTRGESGARSYGGNSRESYGSARSSGSYSASNRSYGQSNRSYSQPSRSYSSAGQRSYSQPSYSQRSMGSSGGGGRYSAPSGGGGRQSGGGSFHGSSGGGGGGGARSSGGGRR
ncbi:MAG TPA: DUF6600 domain-containing protein [Terriglobales bacterium]|nr:DUF6600 domain-containing protein [Terriglobales bacterium]